MKDSYHIWGIDIGKLYVYIMIAVVLIWTLDTALEFTKWTIERRDAKE